MCYSAVLHNPFAGKIWKFKADLNRANNTELREVTFNIYNSILCDSMHLNKIMGYVFFSIREALKKNIFCHKFCDKFKASTSHSIISSLIFQLDEMMRWGDKDGDGKVA